MSTLNPYQSSFGPGSAASSSLARYSVVSASLGWLGFSRRGALLNQLQKNGDLRNLLVASCTESSNRLYFIFKLSQGSAFGIRKYSYQLVRAPRAKSLSKAKSGNLNQFMAEHFPELEAGWVPVAHISNHQLVLMKAQELSPKHIYKEYLIAHVPPVWWRTLFGFSYLRVIAEELNKIAGTGFEVITYIGYDRYLLGKRESPSESNRYSYRLVFVGNVFRVLLRGYAKTCEKRLEQMCDQGWELVTCDGSGLLFKKN